MKQLVARIGHGLRCRTVVRSVAVAIAATALGSAVADGPPPAEEAVQAWTSGRGWLDALQLPRVQDPEAAVRLPRTHGVSVMLRVGGRVVGRGDHVGIDGLALRNAMSRALTDLFADESLKQLADLDPRTLGRRITLEIELAGEPIPLLGATFAEAARRIEPGIDGIAMRRGDRIVMAFPGRLLASNTAGNPVAVFGSLSTELGLGLRDLPELRGDAAVEIYRVPVARLVQPTEGSLPLAPTRAALIVTDRDVSRETLLMTLDGMVARLLDQRYRGPLVGLDEVVAFRGDYRPVADQSRPPVASHFEQALVAYALCRSLGPVDTADGVAAVRHAAETAVRSIRRLALAEASSDRPEPEVDDAIRSEEAVAAVQERWTSALEPRGVAMVVLAAAELLGSATEGALGGTIEDASAIRSILLAAAERLRSIVDEAGVASVRDDAGVERALSGHDQALVAAALARLAVTTGRDADLMLAGAALDVAWQGVPESMRPTLLPWIVIAEDLLLRAGVERDAMPSVRLRETILAAQVGYNDLRMAADMHGGLALVGMQTAPNAQTLRPMVAMALLFANEQVTPEPVRAVMWERHRAMVRFMLQLMVLPPMDGQYRNSGRARFGVRSSLWDSDQPLAAQAMAILAVAETIRVWPSEDRPAPSVPSVEN